MPRICVGLPAGGGDAAPAGDRRDWRRATRRA